VIDGAESNTSERAARVHTKGLLDRCSAIWQHTGYLAHYAALTSYERLVLYWLMLQFVLLASQEKNSQLRTHGNLRWALDWIRTIMKFFGFDPDCKSLHKFRIRTGFGLNWWERIAWLLLLKNSFFLIFWTSFGLGLYSKKRLDYGWTWTEFEKFRTVDPNRKIRQSAHLWQGSLQQKTCSGIYCMGYFSIFTTGWRQ